MATITTMTKRPSFLILPMFLLLMPALTVASAPIIFSSSGQLKGLEEKTSSGTVFKYLGVPYAQPPISDLRFEPPQPLGKEASNNNIDASEFGASCIQPSHMYDVMYPELWGHHRGAHISEDCLFLNVFIPKIDKTFESNDISQKENDLLPIMIWFPGEGYSFGTGSQYDMTSLALNGKVIVVTINYRVSVFGFLSTGNRTIPGNMGLQDKVAAIKWVKENALKFGGHPQKITLFGRFSGAMSVSALLVSPLSSPDNEPLFQRAILQSGVAGEFWNINRNPKKSLKELFNNTNCLLGFDTISEQIECLRRIPARDLLTKAGYDWRLVLSEDTLPDEPLKIIEKGKYVSVPVLLGTTNDEGFLCVLTHNVTKSEYLAKINSDTLTEQDFRELVKQHFAGYLGIKHGKKVLKKLSQRAVQIYGNLKESWRSRYVKLCGDSYILQKTYELARILSKQHKVYLYKFSHQPSKSIHPKFIKAAHGDDVIFSLGLVKQISGWNQEEEHLSQWMTTLWSNFAKTSNPNINPDEEDWPMFTDENRKYLDFSISPPTQVKMLSESWSKEPFWRNLKYHVHHQDEKTDERADT